MTIPARYTLTEAHMVIMELERRVVELEAALREMLDVLPQSYDYYRRVARAALAGGS